MTCLLRYPPALLILAFFVVSCGEPACAEPEGWPEWRGPNRTGAVLNSPPLTDSWPAGAKKMWQTGIATGYGCPVVANGKVYITAGNVLFCLDTSGQVVWKAENPKGGGVSHCTPCVAGGKIYVVLNSTACCYDGESGKEIWKGALMGTGCSASPVVVDGMAVFSGSKILRAFEAATGKELWNQPKAGGENTLHTSPAPWVRNGKTAILQNTQNGQVCVDSKTGAVMWCVDRGSGFQSPVVCDNMEVLGYNNNGTDSVAAWRLSEDKAKKVWETPLFNTLSSVTIYDGCVYAFAEKEFLCIRLENGQILWKQPTQVKYSSALCADGKLFILTNDGKKLAVYKVSADKGEPLGCLDLDGGECASPALADGKLYVRAGNNCAVVCFDIGKH